MKTQYRLDVCIDGLWREAAFYDWMSLAELAGIQCKDAGVIQDYDVVPVREPKGYDVEDVTTKEGDDGK